MDWMQGYGLRGSRETDLEGVVRAILRLMAGFWGRGEVLG